MYSDITFNGRIYVPSNIKDQKQAVVAKFDFRDLLYILVALILFGLGFFITNSIQKIFNPDTISIVEGVEKVVAGNINQSLNFIVGIILGAPVLLAGFKKWDELRFEEYIQVLFSNKVKASNVRINNSDNLFEILEKQKKKKVSSDDDFIEAYNSLNPLAKFIFRLTNKDKLKKLDKINKQKSQNKQNVIKNKDIKSITKNFIPDISKFKPKKKQKIDIKDKIIFN